MQRGYIYRANNDTITICLSTHIFASASPVFPPVSRIRVDDSIFILNTDTKVSLSCSILQLK